MKTAAAHFPPLVYKLIHNIINHVADEASSKK